MTTKTLFLSLGMATILRAGAMPPGRAAATEIDPAMREPAADYRTSESWASSAPVAMESNTDGNEGKRNGRPIHVRFGPQPERRRATATPPNPDPPPPNATQPPANPQPTSFGSVSEVISAVGPSNSAPNVVSAAASAIPEPSTTWLILLSIPAALLSSRLRLRDLARNRRAN